MPTNTRKHAPESFTCQFIPTHVTVVVLVSEGANNANTYIQVHEYTREATEYKYYRDIVQMPFLVVTDYRATIPLRSIANGNLV